MIGNEYDYDKKGEPGMNVGSTPKKMQHKTHHLLNVTTNLKPNLMSRQ